MLFCLVLFSPVVGSVQFAEVRQKIDGFGGAIAYYGSLVTRNPYKQEIYKALFDPVEGLGVSLLRLQNLFRNQPETNFDPDAREIVAAANQYRNGPITILMSSFSPPAALKSNGAEGCGDTNDCTLVKVNGGYDYDGFARYWEQSILRYRAAGIIPSYISLQNEPDYHATWSSCRFNPTEDPFEDTTYAGYDRALAAVRNRLQQVDSPPVIVGPETVGIVPEHLDQFLQSSDPDVIGHHLYNGGSEIEPDTYNDALRALQANYFGKRKYQTEYGGGNGIETVGLIHNSLVYEEANAYLTWGLVWPDTQQLIYVDNSFLPDSQWSYAHGWHPNDNYFALKHYSNFIQPGFQRIETQLKDRNVRMSAYLSPDGSRVVVVLFNPAEAVDSAVQVDLGDFRVGSSAIYRSDFSGSERFAALGPLAADRVIQIGRQSVVTVVVDQAGSVN